MARNGWTLEALIAGRIVGDVLSEVPASDGSATMSRAEYARQYRRRRLAETGERMVHGRFTSAPRTKRAAGEEPPHGTYERYQWRADPCRCDDCRTTMNAYQRARKRARRAQGLDRIHPGDGDPRHGTLNGYCNLMCRCDACRSAAREYERARRSRASTSDPEARP